MEKFTNWRDKGTGIAPFLPPNVGEVSFVSKVGLAAFFILKSVVMLPLMLLNVLVWSKIIYQWILRFLFGWKVDVSVQGVKRRDLNEKKDYPQRDQVYICNSSSPLDAYFLDSIAQGPSWFVIPSGNVMFRMSKKQYMSFALDGSLEVKKFGQEVNSVDQLKGYVTFIFPEGTCSNGKSVLPFEVDEFTLRNFLDPNNIKGKDLKVRTISLKANNALLVPLKLSISQFFIRMIMNDIHCKVKIHEEQPIIPLDNLRIELNDGNKFKLVSKTLNVEAKRSFVEEYTHKPSSSKR